MKKLFSIAVLVFLHLLSPAQDTLVSCDSVCICSDFVVPSGIMIGKVHNKGEWMLSYKLMSMHMEGLLQGSNEINSATVFNTYLSSPEHMMMNMHMLMAMYGVSDKFTVMAMGGFTTAHMGMEMFANSTHNHEGGESTADGHHNMESQGIADLKLYGMYKIYNSSATQLGFTLGINFPVAKTQTSADHNTYGTSRLPYSMQTGSGTFDLLPAITWLHTSSSFTFGAQVSSLLRFGRSVFGYRRGDEWQTNVWAAYRKWGWIYPTLRVESAIAGKMRGADNALYTYSEPDANPANFGSQRISGYLGVQLQQSSGRFSNFNLSLEYGKPFYQQVNGIQMSTSMLLNTSLTVTF